MEWWNGGGSLDPSSEPVLEYLRGVAKRARRDARARSATNRKLFKGRGVYKSK